MKRLSLVIIFINFFNFSKAQTESKMENNNSLLCDPKEGVCEIPTVNENIILDDSIQNHKRPVKVIYFTDPICSSCWGIEPQLRKLSLEYGNNYDIECRMGGLLPDWSYNSGGISKPAHVAPHWDEVSAYYDMPIDGDVWLEDPLSSSYPPSIAFKAAQMQDNKKANLFLRAIRELLFLQKKNITKWEFIELAGKKVGLDLTRFKTDYQGNAKDLFEMDLKEGRALGVRGFPTLFFTDALGNKEIIYGYQPYKTFEDALLKIYPNASKLNYNKNWNLLFSKYPSLTAKEFSVLTGTPRNECENYLDELTDNGKLNKLTTKNGSIWFLKNTDYD